MPNWVANSVHCDDLEVLGKLRDFNRIVPQPLLLDKTESGSNSSHYDKLVAAGLTHQDIIQPENAPSRFVRYGQDDYGNAIDICRPMPLAEWLPHARRYYLCRRLYGHSTWYDWRLAHWGTKWNSSAYRLENDKRCTFETAWTHPFPLLEALSRQHPQLEFEVRYADEDLGWNAGCYTLQNGVMIRPDQVMDGSREAFELAFSFWGGEELFRWDEDKRRYTYIDDDIGNDDA